MSNTAELCARLLEHAAIHDRETSPYSPEQAAWAADLRDAAALIQAGPLDTENVRRQGGGETASLLRSKWRLVFGSRAEHGV